MRIYLDVCCYNRPMDDQTQQRVHLESEAVLNILEDCENGKYDLVGSTVVNYELNKHTNKAKQEEAYSLYKYANEIYDIKSDTNIAERANAFQSSGVGSIDSLHLAAAEAADVDALLSTDDKFITAAKRTDSKVTVVNPVIWMMEVQDDGKKQ